MTFPKNRAQMLTAGYKPQPSGECRACHKVIEFWQTPAGKQIPMDPMETDDSLAITHFATCPFAASLRKGARP